MNTLKQLIKNTLKSMRSWITSFYVVPQTMEHLKNIRLYELNLVISELSQDSSLLEIGAGAGWQSKKLAENGFNVSAIDVCDTNYKDEQIFPVISYDGYTIPFEDKSFDVVFSSNVLEHIPHVVDFQAEIRRVLKDDGICIHLLPTPNWIFWTNNTVLLKQFRFTSVHGERAGNILTELYYFSKNYWDKLFVKANWKIKYYSKNNIFYTGASLMDSRISIDKRVNLSKYFGSSCHYYILEKRK